MVDDSKSEWTAQQWLNYADDLMMIRGDDDPFPSIEKIEAALVAYNQVLQIAPNHDLALQGKGVMILFRGYNLSGSKRYEEAIAAYDQVLQILPDGNSYKNDALSAKWFVMQELGQYEALIISCDQALENSFTGDRALVYKANSLYELEQYEAAIAVYNQILETYPRNFNAFLNKVAVLYQLGRYEEVIATCDKGTEPKYNYSDAIFNKGRALYQLERYAEALTAFDQVLVIKPKHNDALYIKTILVALLELNPDEVNNLDT